MNISTLIIGIISIMILMQGMLLVMTTDAAGSIAMASITVLGEDRHIAGMALLIIATVSLGVLIFPIATKMVRIFALSVQLIITMIYAIGVIRAVLLGSYADNTFRSPEFILSDQIAWLALLLIYSVAITDNCRNV